MAAAVRPHTASAAVAGTVGGAGFIPPPRAVTSASGKSSSGGGGGGVGALAAAPPSQPSYRPSPRVGTNMLPERTHTHTPAAGSAAATAMDYATGSSSSPTNPDTWRLTARMQPPDAAGGGASAMSSPRASSAASLSSSRARPESGVGGATAATGYAAVENVMALAPPPTDMKESYTRAEILQVCVCARARVGLGLELAWVRHGRRLGRSPRRLRRFGLLPAAPALRLRGACRLRSSLRS